MFSILLCEPLKSATAAGWMMFAGVAVAQGIANATDVEPRLRWPNDLYVDDRKLAGILVETRAVGADALAVAIGVGVNCLQQAGHFSDELRDRAVSLDMLSRAPIDRAAIARSILAEFDRLLVASLHIDEATLVELWGERSADIGAHVSLREGIHSYSGTVIDIHPRDGLVLQLEQGGRRHFDPATTTR
jgi:BirA family biotin operon repressor/biotin-[acetyl-CoA-carboxylase] ligase